MIEQKNFEVNNCTEEELLYRCKSLHFSEENTLLAVDFFIKKKRHKALADKLGILPESVTIRKCTACNRLAQR